MVSVDVKHHVYLLTYVTGGQRSGAVWKSRWPSCASVPIKPTVSVDVKQHFNNNIRVQSSRSVWKSRWTSWARVPNKPTVSGDVKQHSKQPTVTRRQHPWSWVTFANRFQCPCCWRRVVVVQVFLYVHRNRRFIKDGSPGRPPRLSHSSCAPMETRHLPLSLRLPRSRCGGNWLNWDYRLWSGWVWNH